MKNYLILLCILILSNCQRVTLKDSVQNKVTTFLKNNKEQGNSYKPILFGELDSAFTSVKENTEYRKYNNLAKIYELYAHDFRYNKEDSKLIKIYSDSMKYYRSICDSLKSNYQAQFIGWKIQHLYQIKDRKNEIVVNNFTFYFDKELKKLIKEEQIYRDLPLDSYKQDPVFYGIK